MHRMRVVMVAGLVGVPSLVFMAYSMARWSPRGRPSSSVTIARPTERVDSSNLPEVTAKLASRAQPQWEAGGIDRSLAEALSSECGHFLRAFVASDLVEYESFMSQRGASLNVDRAEKILRVYLAKRYSAVAGAEWANAPVSELARIAWQRAGERHARWSAIDIDTARAGRGWALPGEEIAKGSAISLTMYDVPDRKDLIQRAQKGDLPSAWIQFPAGFEREGASEVRLTFVYHPGKEKWMPLRLDVLGPDPKPFLLF